MDFLSSASLLALVNILFTNILLSGDNAVVIAMASKNLPQENQKKAIFWGSALAIVLRVVLTLGAVQLLNLPYIKIVGGILLIYIGAQLLADQDDTDEIAGHHSLWSAVRTILIADLIMSIDNVVAVAACANDAPEAMRIPLILLGLCLSIPLIIFGSTLLLKIMEKFPVIISIGAALLGYLAGEMFVQDQAINGVLANWLGQSEIPFQILGVVLVFGFGFILKRSAKNQT